MIYLELFLNFLKIGVVSFGGGYGMIPLIQETVVTKGWLSQEQILNFIAVSESTPGPIAINMATFIGSSQGGILGSFIATLGIVLPSFVIILIIASLAKNLMKFAGVKATLNGIRPTIVGRIPFKVAFTPANFIKFLAREAIINIITNDGRTIPSVAINEPKIPPCDEPINVAIFIAIGPGVDSDTAIKFNICSCESQPLVTTVS